MVELNTPAHHHDHLLFCWIPSTHTISSSSTCQVWQSRHVQVADYFIFWTCLEDLPDSEPFHLQFRECMDWPFLDGLISKSLLSNSSKSRWISSELPASSNRLLLKAGTSPRSQSTIGIKYVIWHNCWSKVQTWPELYVKASRGGLISALCSHTAST